MKLFIRTSIYITIILAIISCRKDFDTISSTGNLRFSKDTIFLDTVFNNLTTVTNTLTVHNRSNDAVHVPMIKLKNDNSKYRLNVDGLAGKIFNDVTILSKDSIFIFIEATVAEGEANDEMLYIDEILFDENTNQQKVTLVTLVQDANLLFNENGNSDFELSTNNFTNEKPYVVFGNAMVPKNATLTVQDSTVVYFHEDSSITLQEGSNLSVQGIIDRPVTFRGDQLSYLFDRVPGQWKGIVVPENAGTVDLNYCKIINPETGLNIRSSQTHTIQNSEIYNASENGIEATNITLNINNSVIGAARINSVLLQGGSYEFNHCTLGNYWTRGFNSGGAIALSNQSEGIIDEAPIVTTYALQKANFNNCIITGNKTNEVVFQKSEDEDTFNFNFSDCLIKLTEKEEANNDFEITSNTTYYQNIIFNESEDFRDTSENDFRIGLDSKAINKGNLSVAATYPKDIINTDRTAAPDLGAYQHIDFKTLEEDKNNE